MKASLSFLNVSGDAAVHALKVKDPFPMASVVKERNRLKALRPLKYKWRAVQVKTREQVLDA